MEENVSGCFFSEHSVIATRMFMTSQRSNDHENHSLRNEDYFNTKTC